MLFCNVSKFLDDCELIILKCYGLIVISEILAV